MYFRKSEHNPPHFHAQYGSNEVEININTLEVVYGKLPNTALYLVKQWAVIHKDELKQIWENQIFKEITPLD
jgi:hypothetical protein